MPDKPKLTIEERFDAFQQDTAAALKTLTIIVIILAVGLAVAIPLAVVGLSNAAGANGAVQSNLAGQARNRADNVLTWCNAINGGRDYDRAFVERVAGGHIRYSLHDLPCHDLAASTRASSHPAATPKRVSSKRAG